MPFQNSLFRLVDKRSVKTDIRTVVRIFRIWTSVPDVVYLAGNFCFGNRKNFCFSIFQLCVIKIYSKKFQTTKLFLIEHACLPYILLPSETDNSRFNSREKHMLTDSVQPYNKPIIDLACSVCTVKYQTSVFFILKNLGLIFHSTYTSRSVNKPLISF
jgi:hypothetical protein